MSTEPWRLDTAARVLTYGDLRASFTGQEANLIAGVAAAAGRCVQYDKLLRVMWPMREPDDAMDIIKVVACRVRAKLADVGFPPALETCWGSGYLWRPATELIGAPLLVPLPHAAELRALLASHHDHARADMLRWAIFGV